MPITSEDQESVVGYVHGVDPGDQSGPEWRPPDADTSFRDRSQQRAVVKPFGTKPGMAVPVFQRAGMEWSNGTFTVGTNPIQLLRRVVGRVSATIWVPGWATNGIAIGPDPGPLQVYLATGNYGSGVSIFNPGDSDTLITEAPCWVICQNGQTTGTVAFDDFFNPAVLDPLAES